MASTGLIQPGGAPCYSIEDGKILDYTDRSDPSTGGAAGGLQSTAADLLDFAEALGRGRLLKKTTMAEMATFIDGEDYSAFNVKHSYGLGLERYVSDDLTVLGHLGSGDSHSAFIGFDADRQTVAVVMLNVRNPGPQAVMAIEALAAAAQVQP
jgi:D-alanyl-D-alanine carboxypeptidase